MPGARLGGLAWSAAACLALLVGTAAAQQEPVPKKAEAKPNAAAPRKVIPEKAAAKPDAATKIKAKSKAGKSGCGSAGAGAVDLTPASDGPQPRWVCNQPVCNIDPLWNGERIECVFMIRNEGEADLNIKAKGG
jgi:hypothetical protein